MRHIILLNAVDIPFTASSLMPDNGLASLAACLRAQQHHVEIWDPGSINVVRDHIGSEERTQIDRLRRRVHEGRIDASCIAEMYALEISIDLGLQRVYARLESELEARLARGQLHVLGLKLWIGAAAEVALKAAQRLLVRYPGLHVFAGGPLACMEPEQLLRKHPFLSGVCYGEGEETLVALVSAIELGRNFASAPNLLYHDGASFRRTESKVPSLEDLPLPAYEPEVYPSLAAGHKLPLLCIDESRGCPMRCPFCAHSSITGNQWRVVGADRIVTLMAHYRRTLGVRAFRFAGSSTPRRVYRDVAKALERQSESYIYSGFAHVNAMRPEDFPLLKRSGLVSLFFGIESGDPEILRKTLVKRTTPARIRTILNASMDAGIFTVGSVIFPAPGETSSSENATRELLLELFGGGRPGSVCLQPPLPEPGTPWWRELQRYGFQAKQEGLLNALIRRRVRRFLPPALFEPLPYSLDGQGYSAMSERTSALTRVLDAAQIIVNMADDSALIAIAAGIPPRDFHVLNHDMFMTSDADGLSALGHLIRGSAHE